jgi:hypothetical protein
MKSATLALIIRHAQDGPVLVETLSDDREINLLEGELQKGDPDPLDRIHAHREQVQKEEEEFGDYVEELLSQPFVRPEIQDHGLQWLKSKIRIEQYQRSETDAARVIADYAYRVYREDPARTDFVLAGPTNKVRIRVFVVEPGQAASEAA